MTATKPMGQAFPPPECILVVDDHSLVRDGLRSVLEACFPGCTIY